MKGIIWELFIYNLRWSRSKFNIIMLIITIIALLIWGAIFALSFPIDNIYFTLLSFWILFILVTYITTLAFIKRLHDLNLSWLFFFIAFIPTVNILFTLYLSVFKWTTWKNDYWLDTLHKKNDINL